MKLLAAAIASVAFFASTSAQADHMPPLSSKAILSQEDVGKVAPALEKYTHDRLLGEVWKRPGLATRDRSIATLAALIARGQTIEMPHYLYLALENGVKPREISEIITHLAFYSGWPNAMPAVVVTQHSLAARGF